MHTALKAIPQTKPHDKAKPWECWWFDDNCKQAKRNLHIAARNNLNKLPGSRADLRKVRHQTLETYKQAKHKKWNEICQSLNLGSSLSVQWRRLCWIYNGGSPPKRTLIATAKAMANESMALFSQRSNPSNLNLATRMVTEALSETRKTRYFMQLAHPPLTQTRPLQETNSYLSFLITKNHLQGQTTSLTKC